jgi:hypothetical protein
VTLVAGPAGSESGTVLPSSAQPGSAQPGSSGPHAALKAEEFVDRLERLAAELGQRGLQARLVTPVGRVPSLHVVNPVTPRLAEDVYVGRSQDGLWWFWWPWAERIARGDEISEAAAIIGRVLSTAADLG